MCSTKIIVLIIVMPFRIVLIFALESLVLKDSQVLLSFKGRHGAPRAPVILADLVFFPPSLSLVLSFWA